MEKVASKINALVAALATLVLLFSGCALPGKSTSPTLEIRFTTNWSSSGYHYYLAANEPLPGDFKVVVTEKDTGIRQEIQGSQITQRLPNKYDVRPDITLREGKTYRIEGFAGAASVGNREIEADEASLAEPADTTVRGTYSITMKNVDNNPDEKSDMFVHGTGTLDANPSKTILKLSGTGSVNTSGEGFSQRITVTNFEEEQTDGNTTRSVMVGQGPWTLAGDPAGSGQASVRMEFLGRESKADKTGKLYLCEKSSTKTDISGTLTSGGESIQYTNHSTETEWTRVDTEEVIWHTLVWSTTYTYQGDVTPENGNLDEAAPEEAADPQLLDVVDFTGFQPFPPSDGDTFLQKGKEDVTIQYVITDGGIRQAAGQSFATLKVSGTVSSGASGTETWYVVRDGSLATLPISWNNHYSKGTETADFKAELLTIA